MQGMQGEPVWGEKCQAEVCSACGDNVRTGVGGEHVGERDGKCKLPGIQESQEWPRKERPAWLHCSYKREKDRG